MIKVGDKLHHQGKEWNVEFSGEPFVHLKHGGDFIIESSHIFWNKLYVEQKQRADELEKYIKIMRDNYSEINKDAQTILRTAPDDVLLKAQIRWNNDVIKILDKILEDDNA